MSRVPKPSGQDDYREFLSARLDPTLSNGRFAAHVCALAIFQEKHALAVAIAGRRDAQADDAGQQAVLTILAYLTRTRGWDFQGTSPDEFGGWLYCLSRQHIRWALGNIGRSTRRRQHHEHAASRPLMLCADVEPRAILREKVIEAILKLPVLRRRIMAAILRAENVEVTARRLGISRRTYYRLRKEALDLLRKLLSDGDDDCSSLVPA